MGTDDVEDFRGDSGVDVVTGALQRAAATGDPVLRGELTTRAIRTAYRTRQLNRLAGFEALLVEMGGPVLDLVDASRAVLADDIRGAIAVLAVASEKATDPIWLAAVAGVTSDVLISATRIGQWRDASELAAAAGALLRRVDAVEFEDVELGAVLRGVEFDVLGASALIEHHTSTAAEPRSVALDALSKALEVPRTRHLLGSEHGYALLAHGSVLNGRRELGPAAVALARAVHLIGADRPALGEWVRAELALVRVRQARWDDARRLADDLAGGQASGSGVATVTAAAVLSVMAALDGRFADARRFAEREAGGPGQPSVIVSVLTSHARIASAIGRNNWSDLLHALDDLEHQGHRHVFDTHEWHALRAMAVWHLHRLDEYRALVASWAQLQGADAHAYRLAHVAIIARIDGDREAALAFTRRAVDALDDGYDPLGRTWVRIVAGTHISLLDDPVLGLTHYEDARTELLALGADGFAGLCTAIIRSTSDELTRSRRNDPLAALTDQQRQIASLVAAGYTSTEIGELLHLSRKTIDFHVANIIIRLGVRTRREIGRAIGSRED